MWGLRYGHTLMLSHMHDCAKNDYIWVIFREVRGQVSEREKGSFPRSKEAVFVGVARVRKRAQNWPAVRDCSHSSLWAPYLETQWAIPRCSRAKAMWFLRLTQPYCAPAAAASSRASSARTPQSLLSLPHSTEGRIGQWCRNCHSVRGSMSATVLEVTASARLLRG